MDAITEHQIKQYNRWHARLMERAGYGGHFGWDMPTIAIVHPGIYNSYRRLCDMARPIRQKIERERHQS